MGIRRGVGNHRVPHDTICDTRPTIAIISRYSGSEIINILLDNPITMHNDICLTRKPK